MRDKRIFIFMHRTHPGRGTWRLLRFCESTKAAAQRTAKGWRSAGAEVRIISAKIEGPFQ